jgi:hypothetical protein
MNNYGIVLFLVLATGIIIAGCTSTQTAPPVSPSPVARSTVPSPSTSSLLTPQPSFSLGDAYLNKPGGYSFQSEKDIVTEQFRVDNPSWGLSVKVQPLLDYPQYCWFRMVVTNIDTGQSYTYGYGRDYSLDQEQKIPMFTTGPYKLEMSGNRVKVWVTAAKRSP